ncbi:MAG TPA: RHS repeat-associated core domain-containing protein, partial [Gemmatimonadales bacterium]|nr:RHS repeat-associated core domain-containing protein [Gemmatimonadales bacterium]
MSARLRLLSFVSICCLFLALPTSARAQGQGGGSSNWAVTVGTSVAVLTHDTASGPHTIGFVVTNTGTKPNTVTLTCGATGEVTCDGLSPASVTLAPDEAVTVDVTYSVGLDDGSLELTAAGEHQSGDAGQYLVKVAQPPAGPVTRAKGGGGGSYNVIVVPDNSPRTLPGYSGPDSLVFSIANIGSYDDEYTLTCSRTGGLTCVSVVPSTLALDAYDDGTATGIFNVGGTGGTLTLTATGEASDVGSYLITATLPPTITLQAPVLTSGSRAVVRNRQPIIRATYLPGSTPVDTTDTVLTWDGENVTALARHNRGLIEWEVDSTRWLAVGDSAQIELTVCTTAGACSTVTRWAVLPNDNQPILGFTGMPFEALGSGFSAPFGPGISLSGAEVEMGLSSVPYSSMGQARSFGLVYSSRQSYPRALVPVDLELTWPAGTPLQIKLTLFDGVLRLDSLKLTSPTCATGAIRRCRAVLQGDFKSSSFATPTRKWLRVEAQVTSGGTTKTSVDSAEVVLVDRRTTWYGAGWWPTAALKLVQAGSDRMLIGPTGTATIFRGNGDSLYLAPPGVFTTLKRVTGGWEIQARGSTAKLVFDSYGRLTSAVDRNGNSSALTYSGTSDQLTALTDPVGKAITLAYDGNAKLYRATDPGGRQTRIWINPSGNQVGFDSLSAPSHRHWYYWLVVDAGTKTYLPYQRIGVNTDTTRVLTSATFPYRPDRVELPLVQDETGSWVKPLITYTAYEAQGYGSLRSLDSVYVELKDPRGNWTRSLLNRWGQARKTWDAIGLLAKTQYDPDGFVLWSEGKNGDSSRVYSVYDGLKRLVKTYLVRSASDTLRLDSLVYDASHRVIKRVDARGKVDSTTYDANGNVIAQRDAAGNTMRYVYLSDGRLDSIVPPSGSNPTKFIYETTWKQVNATWTTGHKLSETTYDSYGRVEWAMQKTPVRDTTSGPKWQWRRTRSYVTPANQPDSVVTHHSTECSDPCNTPPGGGWPSVEADSLRMMRVGYRYNAAGQVEWRLNERAVTDTVKANGLWVYTVYDRLGRVVTRQPSYVSAVTPKDSLVYDVAGNLVKTITRRGHTITTTYDSRNRATHTVIPGVGTLRKTFGGPQDQVTRMWYDSPVDSIGGVNGELRWAYDQRGRLKADTAYTGSTVRARTYTYDHYERDSTMTDPVGVWRTFYDANRGYPNKLVSPFADSVKVARDNRGRLSSLDMVASGYPTQTRTPEYGGNGELDYLTHTVSGWTSGKYDRPGDGNEPGVGPALGPTWTEKHGAGGGLDSLVVDTKYDGWERLLQWRLTKNGSQAVADSATYGFDRTGNLMTASGNEVYGLNTDRLTSGHGWTYSYDNAGNLTSRTKAAKTWTYGYDALNRLMSVRYNGTLIARYGYDVLGRRIVKKVYDPGPNGATVGYTRFVYSGDHVAYETNEAGTIGMRYIWGPGTDNLVGVRFPNDNQYVVVGDNLGNVRGLVQRNGSWIGTLRYDPYGTAVDSTGSALGLRYRWTGREYDAETGWYYHRSRYYDPQAKRFTQEDPVGFAGGGNLYS